MVRDPTGRYLILRPLPVNRPVRPVANHHPRAETGLLRPAEQPKHDAPRARLAGLAGGLEHVEIAGFVNLKPWWGMPIILITEATIKTHLIHIFSKLGVDDRTAAVTMALERGILRLRPPESSENQAPLDSQAVSLAASSIGSHSAHSSSR